VAPVPALTQVAPVVAAVQPPVAVPQVTSTPVAKKQPPKLNLDKLQADVMIKLKAIKDKKAKDA